MFIKVDLEVKITKEDIEEVIEMAGYGISYWCSQAIEKEDCYEVYEDEEDKWHKLSYEDIARGIKKCIENGWNSILDHGESYTCWMTIDAGQIDSEIADVIIQYACFDKIIYG